MGSDNVYDKECFNPDMVFSEDEKKVLNTMYNWGRGAWTPNFWEGYSELERKTVIDKKELRKIMKSLKERKVVYYAPTYPDEDTYEICGSGYFITDIEGFEEMIKVED